MTKTLMASILISTGLMAGVNEVIKVTSSEPITVEEDKISYTNECVDEQVPVMEDIYEYKTVNDGSVIGGLATGAGVGAIVHNNVGGGSGKKWATGIASVLGYGAGSAAFGTTQTYRRKIGEITIGYRAVQNCQDVEHIEKVEKAKFLLKGKSKITGKIVTSISDEDKKTFVYQYQQK